MFKQVIDIVVIRLAEHMQGSPISEQFRSSPRTCRAAPAHTRRDIGSAVSSSASEKEQHLQTLSVRFRGGTA
jgi:hypothetical protein